MNSQIGAGAPLVRWMGQWVTEDYRATQRAVRPRVEVPTEEPEREPVVIRLHLESRPNLYEWS